MTHLFYLGVITILIGFLMACLEANQPNDCSVAAEASMMIGETNGIRDTLKGYAQ